VKPNARRVAVEALARIDDGAYANLVLPGILDDSALPERDRHLVTELVYGTTRMRRACDFLVDRFVMRELDGETRRALRLGAYQLQFMRTPAHAAVSATVDVAPKRSRGLVNAVLRKVSSAPVAWPDIATELSYPDWIVERLVADLGTDDAMAALRQMDEAPTVTVRADGYVQDLASQWVAEAVGCEPGERVADTCAGPGGKATAMAATGAWIGASDAQPGRAGLVLRQARHLDADVGVVTADGRRPAFRPASFDRVLVDAPCSGLGVLRRRPDARWRGMPEDVERLASLQRDLVAAAADLVRPGGTLVYSVCTLTNQETLGVDGWLAEHRPDLTPESLTDLPGGKWRPHGRGAILLPQAAGTDGMFLLRVRRGGVEL
jgi:16S rRNA (cytosine967-C5)-methyltransferase